MICRVCKHEKDAVAFDLVKDRRGRHIRRRQCRKCRSKYQRDWVARNRGKANAYARNHRERDPFASRNAHLKNKHGVDHGIYVGMLEKQQGKCAICGGFNPGVRKHFYVDHDHASGVVRELLCSSCNSLLGFAKDNAATLRNAALYLEKHRGG